MLLWSLIEIFLYYLVGGMVDWLLLFYCGAGCYWNHHTKTVKEHSRSLSVISRVIQVDIKLNEVNTFAIWRYRFVCCQLSPTETFQRRYWKWQRSNQRRLVFDPKLCDKKKSVHEYRLIILGGSIGIEIWKTTRVMVVRTPFWPHSIRWNEVIKHTSIVRATNREKGRRGGERPILNDLEGAVRRCGGGARCPDKWKTASISRDMKYECISSED